MTKPAAAFLSAALMAVPLPASHAQPFDPIAFRPMVREPHSEILVLGSPHLAEIQGEFDVAWLEPLVAALERYRPAAIITESLPVEALHNLVAYEAIYPDVANMFAATRLRLSTEAATRLATSSPAAEAQARNLLERWPAQPTPVERRRLAALFIAAGDIESALVQWLRLAEPERVAQDGISEEAATELRRKADSRNETVSIADRLAARLGLERVWAMDDQSESDLVFSALEAVVEAEGSAELAAARARRPLPSFTPMTSAESVVTAFREHNADETGRRDAEHQWLTRLETDEHGAIQRRRVAAWETRNLRMAANIREVSARYPGQRILVVVGSAHKPYLEAYMRMMSDVRIVPADDVIGVRD